MDSREFRAYCDVTGFHPSRPARDALKDLLNRHLAVFPFQTVSVAVNEPIPLDAGSIFRKLVEERRGGYCYELNLLLADALTFLGFSARPLTGSVFYGERSDEYGARTHMVLEVTLDGQPWLVDAGFGGLCPSAPLRLDSEKAQSTPHGDYWVTPRDGRYIVSTRKGGERRMLYVLDRQPQRPIDLEVGNWFVSTHPRSPFRSRLMAARTLPDGTRHTLLNSRYTFHTPQGSSVHTIADAPELTKILRSRFEINLPNVENLESRLQAFINTPEGTASRF